MDCEMRRIYYSQWCGNWTDKTVVSSGLSVVEVTTFVLQKWVLTQVRKCLFFLEIINYSILLGFKCDWLHFTWNINRQNVEYIREDAYALNTFNFEYRCNVSLVVWNIGSLLLSALLGIPQTWETWDNFWIS
jgi:hypothetical protein